MREDLNVLLIMNPSILVRIIFIVFLFCCSSCSRVCVKIVDENDKPISGAIVLPRAPFFYPRSSASGRLCFDYGRIIFAEGYEPHLIESEETSDLEQLDGKKIILSREVEN